MPRPRWTDRPQRLDLSITESDLGWLTQHLWSDVEARVPRGAYAAWFRERIAEFRASTVLDLTPYGMPPGYFVRGPAEVITALRTTLERATLAQVAKDIQEHV